MQIFIYITLLGAWSDVGIQISPGKRACSRGSRLWFLEGKLEEKGDSEKVPAGLRLSSCNIQRWVYGLSAQSKIMSAVRFNSLCY